MVVPILSVLLVNRTLDAQSKITQLQQSGTPDKQGQAQICHIQITFQTTATKDQPCPSCAEGGLEFTRILFMFIERMLLSPDNLQKQTDYCQKVGQCHLKPV